MKKILLSLVFVFVIALPSSSHAQVPFGGLDTWEYPCTCSPYTYVWFAPLFIATPVPVTGGLAFPDSGVLFAFYGIFPSMWALGTYTPGVQSCWMYAVAGCFFVPTTGVINQYSATGPTI